MNKKHIDIILAIICFIGFLFTDWYGLTFLSGAFFGEYFIERFNLFETDEKEEIEESWASQFEINKHSNNSNEENNDQQD
jgi:hypothetical protein